MPENGDDDELELAAEEPAEDGASPRAESEKLAFAKATMKPNTAVIPLWKDGHISFNPDSSVSVFALIALALLLITVLLVTLIGIGLSDAKWVDSLATALGHAITGVVGAIVGSSVTKKDKLK